MKLLLTLFVTSILTFASTASAVELHQASSKKQLTEWQQICKPDKKVPVEWKSYQQFLLTTDPGCDNNFYRYVNYPVTEYKGISKITERSDLQNSDICKIKKISKGPNNGFEVEHPRIPYSKINIQVLPLETLDFKSTSTPTKDYGHFFQFLETWLKNNSDNEFSASINIPSNYLKFNKFLGEYREIGLHGGSNTEFINDAMNTVDPIIDFAKTNMVIIIVPPQVDPSLLSVGPGAYGTYKDGNSIFQFMTITPFNFTNTDRPNGNTSFLSPEILLHQFQHANYDFGDYTEAGAWGLMSLPSTTDLLGWQKYITGFYKDNQVRCLPTLSSSTSVLTPSVAKSTSEKLAVIPIDKSKVVVLESMRSGGFNYKLPKNSEGLLVYEVEANTLDYSVGIKVIGTKRGMATERLMGATLKKKESVVTNGFKITVTESGTFGDVVKVEKAS